MNKTITFDIDTSSIDRLAIGGRLFDMFLFSGENFNFHCAVSYDRDRKTYSIDEKALLKMVEIVNNGDIEGKHFEIAGGK